MARRLPQVIPPSIPAELPPARLTVSKVDAVHTYFQREYADEEGHKLINTFDGVDSVYGSRFMDKAALAFKIFKDAKDAGDPVVSRMTPAEIKSKLEWCARRHNDLENGIAVSRSARIKLLAYHRQQRMESADQGA